MGKGTNTAASSQQVQPEKLPDVFIFCLQNKATKGLIFREIVALLHTINMGLYIKNMKSQLITKKARNIRTWSYPNMCAAILV